ncbi:MAG: PucR family transcriptional regulator [Candidatus Dormibacteria bacterium]
MAQILEALGDGVIRVVAAPHGLDVDATGVAIFDEVDLPLTSPGTLLLGVGMSGAHQIEVVAGPLFQDGAILVVKVPQEGEGELAANAHDAGVTVLAVTSGAAWLQVASLLRSLIAEDPTRDGEELGGVAAGDLFAVANAISALIDAPITIEDPESRVIAYSVRQDEADEARMQTILGRQIPDEYFSQFRSQGVFRRLYREAEPLYLDDIGPDVIPRLAVSVRAGDELLGSIWAAVKKRPPADRVKAFAESASLVAVHLLRQRLVSDAERGLQAILLGAILGGGPLAADAASRLGLAGDAFRVVAVGIRTGDAVDNQHRLARCWDALSLHLSVIHRRAVCGVAGGVVYAVVPLHADRAQSRRVAVELGEGLIHRLPSPLASEVLVAIGGHVDRLAHLPRSRREADEVLRVLRGQPASASRALAAVESMRLPVLLLRLADLATDDDITMDSPLSMLLEHDAAHGTHHVETLNAYLDAFGDVGAAAKALRLHHNTLRYRLQKLQAIPGLNLADPEQRLALLLELKLRGPVGR